MKSILFLCVANSARSQMAEGLARKFFGPDITVQSAGSNPSVINPNAIKALAEVDIEANDHHSKSVETIDTDSVDVIITLCSEEICPIVRSDIKQLHWPITDPATDDPEVGPDEMMDRFRCAREEIQARLEQYISETGISRVHQPTSWRSNCPVAALG